MVERISATQAVRQFSDLLNRALYQGTVVELERGNRVIARISPVTPESRSKAEDLNDFFAELLSLGKDAEVLAKDLAGIRKRVPLERGRWD